MAETETQLAAHQEDHASTTDVTDTTDEKAPTAEPKADAQTTEAKQQLQVDDEDFPPPQMSEATRIKSVRMQQQLRVVVQDLFTTENGDNVQADVEAGVRSGAAGSNLNVPHDSSMVKRAFSSIMIDEINDDTMQFEDSIIALPKSPICALLLMESIGLYEQLNKVNRVSIVVSILGTAVAQITAGCILFWKQLYSESIPTTYEWSDCWINLVVIAFIVIYLSQDCAQIYKMVVLLRWMRAAEKLKRHSAVMIGLYLVTNFLLYVFLLYYSIVELLINERVVEKLQAAVAVYFILEVDDWLYNVTIEPLKILDEEIYNLNIRGAVGSRNRRLRHITFWFWGALTAVLILQFVLFVTRAQHELTISD